MPTQRFAQECSQQHYSQLPPHTPEERGTIQKPINSRVGKYSYIHTMELLHGRKKLIQMAILINLKNIIIMLRARSQTQKSTYDSTIVLRTGEAKQKSEWLPPSGGK